MIAHPYFHTQLEVVVVSILSVRFVQSFFVEGLYADHVIYVRLDLAFWYNLLASSSHTLFLTYNVTFI